MSPTSEGANSSKPAKPQSAKSRGTIAPPGSRPPVRRRPVRTTPSRAAMPPVRRNRPAYGKAHGSRAGSPERKRGKGGWWLLPAVLLALAGGWFWPTWRTLLPIGGPAQPPPSIPAPDPGERFRQSFQDAIETRQIGAARTLLAQLRAVEAEHQKEASELAELENSQKVRLEAQFEQTAGEANLPGMQETLEAYRALWPDTSFLAEWRERIERLLAKSEREAEVSQLWQKLDDYRRGLQFQRAYLTLQALKALDEDVTREMARLVRIVRLPNGDALRFRYIPAGSFMMGSPDDELDRGEDETRHQVTLTKAFWMMETEVTQAHWDAVISWNPSSFKNPGNPAENLSKEDALHFIRKLNKELASDRFRLPTEAEWEYACRAGTTSVFHTGDHLSTDQANYDGNYPYGDSPKGRYRGNPLPVATLPANPWGLHDMHGNVWEFCSDIYEPLGPDSVTDPTGSVLFRAPEWVIRGGGWGDFAASCRSAARFRVKENHRANNLGFRLVMKDSP